MQADAFADQARGDDHAFQRLADPLAYTTVLTVLRILESKGYVGHTEEGRVHRYYASVGHQTARKSALRHLTDKLFEGSSELLMTQLVSDQKLTAEQVQRLRQRTDEQRFRQLLRKIDCADDYVTAQAELAQMMRGEGGSK